jgi:hypothetical protein
MEHLSLETLARLVDERPSPQQREHLASCAACASELRALKMQTESLGGLPALRPPHGDWAALEARLSGEGLVTTTGHASRFSLHMMPGWMQAAAALILFVGGAGVGAAFAGSSTPAGTGGSLVNAAESIDGALQLVQNTERQYMDALVRLSQLTRRGQPQAQDPVSRVAALEALLAASQEAVRVAPEDPVFNGFLANVLAERQATLRQISAGDDNWF